MILVCILVNVPCTNAYNPNMFTILQNPNSELQLSMIKCNIMKYQPNLCEQKELYDFLLFKPTDSITTKPDLVKKKKWKK